MTRTRRSPIEFINDGRRILTLGYSVGHWEGKTLIVTTTRIDWPNLSFYGFEGAPQSTDTVITERFHFNEVDTSFEYDIIANDPVNFTEPVVANGYYIYKWRPDLQITPPEECGPEFLN